MSTIKGLCEICGTEIELRFCCNAFDCGCMGMPIDPPVCSKECYDKYMNSQKSKSNFIPIKKIP